MALPWPLITLRPDLGHAWGHHIWASSGPVAGHAGASRGDRWGDKCLLLFAAAARALSMKSARDTGKDKSALQGGLLMLNKASWQSYMSTSMKAFATAGAAHGVIIDNST